MENKPRISIYACNLRFVEPYLTRELAGYEITWPDGTEDCDLALLEPAEPLKCRATTVLRCPNVIGTGMTGWPMRLAAAIYKGWYVHTDDDDVVVQAIHATDVARAAKAALGVSGEYTVTDLSEHSLAALADALSYRMKQKRVLDVPWKWLRLPARMMMKQFRPEPIPAGAGQEFALKFGFVPVDVVEYLKTHVYDDESL